jgi:2-polyprenyl-6-methoxyphenol hydroxylase-like FAD-dependent oxidoreductase
MHARPEHDVVIVGASLAGCTAAMLFARAGLRVALVERHRAIDAYKRICTHFVQPSGVPTLERLGLLPALRDAGAVSSGMDFWSRWGWVRPPDEEGAAAGLSRGLNIRREKLDPIVRRAAAATPGVELILGHTARRLLTAGSRVSGVVVEAQDGEVRELTAPLTVGADGRNSDIARLAAVKARVKPHNRFMYYAYYRDLEMGPSRKPRVWVLEPDLAYAFPTDEGLTLMACAPSRTRLAAFKSDIAGSFTRIVNNLPDGPRFDDSQRVSDFSGIIDFQNIYRSVTAPGLALIGDAALAADFIWGVGCGWALQSAEWLAQCTAGELLSHNGLERGLARYRRKHHSALRGHFFMISDFARGRPLNPIEKVFLSAGARDTVSAEHFGNYASRNIGLLRLLSPRAVGRALFVSLTR